MKRKMIKRGVSAFVALAMSASIVGATPAFANIADNLDPNKLYSTEYDSWQDYINYAAELAVEIAGEGFVMLKNENDTLPLEDVENITVLGTAADSIVAGGGGSGAQSRPESEANDLIPASTVQVTDALTAAGFNVNPDVMNVYRTVNSIQMPSLPGSFGANNREGGTYMTLTEDASAAGAVEFAGNYYVAKEDSSLASVEDSFAEYGDAAVVVIGRSGSEGADNPTNNVAGHTDPNEHYFELDDAEKEMLAYAKAHFDKIVVVINSPSAMELGVIENDDAIGGMVWFGQPGFNGTFALGKILNGEVNPSGKTTDFYMADFTQDPTFYNFGTYTQTDIALGEESSGRSVAYPLQGASATGAITAVDYAEGIYVGYRYYETVAAELGAAGEAWYQQNVVYPFGYGLSYTTFSQEITEIEGDLNSADGSVTVTVEVTNTGDVAGKDVVELYVTKPYTAGEIEKSAVDLVEFGKTDILEPGESETITLTASVYDLSSFDYDDRNNNDFCGWEFEEGDYIFSIRSDSHNVLDEETLTCSEASQIDGDDDEDTPNNIYSQTEGAWAEFNTHAHAWTVSGEDHYLTREALVDEDGDVIDVLSLAWLATDDNDFTDAAFTFGEGYRRGYAYEDHDNALTAEVETDYVNLWTKTEADIPEDWTQGAGTLDADGNYEITLWEMRGLSLDDEKWVDFMNQLTLQELITFVSTAGYGNGAVDSVNKPWIDDNDGPAQLGCDFEGMAWPVAVVISSTWNKELAYEHGIAVGLESMYVGSSGWYGPSLNFHRSPFGGRNFEYYSQDGVHAGKMVAQVIKGAVEKGCHVYAKHAFMNDQETARCGLATFATEQALREIYAKSFELCVTEGGCNGYMNAFSRIGLATSLGYATTRQLYENEWGFDGMSVTDYWAESYANDSGYTGWAMVRGNSIPLNTNNNRTAGIKLEGVWNAEENMVYVAATQAEANANQATLASPGQWYWIRTFAQRCFYTVVNTNAMMNGLVDITAKSDVTELVAYEEVEAGLNILTEETREEIEACLPEGYVISASGLPTGVKVAADGTLSGIPGISIGSDSAVGRYTVTIRADGLGSYNSIN
ncbi:MAG: hypothetical protein E7370_03890, partial [Clostridiales bacterium]|nr:hypothetical protein [Clostridiales bacterium]